MNIINFEIFSNLYHSVSSSLSQALVYQQQHFVVDQFRSFLFVIATSKVSQHDTISVTLGQWFLTLVHLPTPYVKCKISLTLLIYIWHLQR